MCHDVVAVNLLENTPVIEAAITGHVVKPNLTLHLQILSGIAVICGALYLYQAANIVIVGLNMLTCLEEVGQYVANRC